MASLRQALANAVLMYRPAAVKYTLYRGHEAVELNEDAFAGRCDFVIPENGHLPVAQSIDASILLADLIYEGIGYRPPEPKKGIPKFIRDTAAKRSAPEADPFEPAPSGVRKIKKKSGIKKKGTPLTKRR